MSFVTKMFGATASFLREVKAELKKTSFPDRKTTTRNTVIVVVFSLAVAFFLGSLDMLFTYLLNSYVF